MIPAESQRFELFMAQLSRMAAGETHERIPISPERDALDAIAFGINMLAAELSFTNVSRDSMTNIINAISDMLIVVGGDGTILNVNSSAAKILGRADRDLVGRALGTIVTDLGFSFARLREELLQRRSASDVECHFLSAAGDAIPMMVNAAFASSGTEPESIVLVARDMRQTHRLLRRAAEAEIERRRAAELAIARDAAEDASRAKSAFLAGVTHEIRTPMTVILGSAQILKRLGGDAKLREEFLKRIETSGQTLLLLIEDLLDISRIEAGKVKLETSDVSALELMRAVVADLRAHAATKSIALELVCEDGFPTTVASDPLRLKQILTNVVGNAIKFTPSGTVTARLFVAPDNPRELCIEVADTGIGIPTSKQSELFTPFYQVDNTIARRYGGTGLGLALSRKLARLLGGELRLAASRENEGSSFCLTLPLGGGALERPPALT
ncbi:MAG: PAS domain S-box protein [Deltaproteobacteria bacterium]|nr:PAS domain S-box protein [Deltaproteobacteria bacterium]